MDAFSRTPGAPTPQGSPPLVEGTIAAVDENGNVQVVLDGEDHRYIDCPVVGAGTPERGQRCLVGFAEGGGPWCLLAGLGALSSDGHEPFIFDQVSPSANWIINHPFHGYPQVRVIDTATGNRVETGLTYTSLDQVVVHRSGATSGKAVLSP